MMMARPFFVAMRAKNPNWRTRRFWEGCNVLFIGGPQIREGKHTGRARDDKRKLSGVALSYKSQKSFMAGIAEELDPLGVLPIGMAILDLEPTD